jgi:hypothetical protein
MTYDRVEKYLHAFLTLALKGESWVLSLGQFTLKERAAGTQRAGLDAVEKGGGISCPSRELNK